MRKLLASFALGAVLTAGLVAPAVTASAATAPTTKYYVSCAAKTAGDGSSSKPWNSLAAVNAHGAFAAGSSILLKRGTSCTGRLHPTGSGSAKAPNLIGAYGSGARPTINGGGTATNTAAVELVNVKYWTVQDLHITNHSKATKATAYRSGLLFLNTGVGRLPGMRAQRLLVEKVVSNITMKYADAREWGGIAALTYGVKNDGFDGLTIANNTVKNVGRTGIMVSNKEHGKGWDKKARVTANTVRAVRGDGIVMRGSLNGRIDHNVSASNGRMQPCSECRGASPDTANAGIWVAGSNTIRVDHNEAYGQRVWGGDGEGFDVDASAVNVVLEYNYSHDNQGGGVLLCGSKNTIVRFNIFENNLKSAIAFIGTYPAKTTSIYNNTIYVSKKSDAGVVRYFNGAHAKGIKFYNNIVYSYAKGYYLWPTKVTSKANTYVGTHKSGEPHGAGYSWSAPGLKNPGTGGNGITTLKGYKPLHSATFRKGIAVPKSVTTDFFGKKINPKHPPRGAAA